MAPSVQGKWPWPFPADPAGPLLSARPSTLPHRGFLFVQRSPSSISRGLPGGRGGSDFLHQTLELPMGPGQTPQPPPPASNIWLGGRHVGITGGQGGLRSQMASEMWPRGL